MGSPEFEDRAGDPLAGHPSTLRPLTRDLVAAVLTHRGHTVAADADGALVGRWAQGHIWFLRAGDAGELLQVRTVAVHAFSVEDVPWLHDFCNTWNRDRFWPKAFVHVDDAGRARVCGEAITDLERGVTPHQLDRLLDRGISAGCRLAAEVGRLAGTAHP
ncbi:MULTISPECIES: YbjN domain-containing protein [unclassified Micromonospora]|uniref:YbjN domain-containing protein n=1 Tax=unclassified Micromonospora TaxID=2617518 RepID=UPI0022B68AA4|nr:MULTISPECIES: YbjN domain-containing protein [unclassified Micromonospora]MCZ7420300.1 YbjN domain-containing protein [Verrucosispora sp. WMMA2121]WBB89193.1 YbjN domain-containing protein [Verrucosispora sp. WMMC514]